MPKAVVVLLASLAMAGALGWGASAWRATGVGPVQRGSAVATSLGCFACHGPGGLRAFEDPGGGIGSVPSFSADELKAYARNDGELREWILDGLPRRFREERRRIPPGERPLFAMPAWRGRLSARELDDLVAYVKTVSDFETPQDAKAAAGREAAGRLGCFNCHGPQGRGDLPNPGSLKGRIPAWDGTDFPHLVRDDEEVRAWILDGAPPRLKRHLVARWFLTRQAIQMPAYRGRITDDDLALVVAYIRWLRAS